MISLMRARVSSRTKGDSLMTRETVFFDTLASRAMSLIVCLRWSSSTRMLSGTLADEDLRGAFLAAFLGMVRVFRGNRYGWCGVCGMRHLHRADPADCLTMTPVSRWR
jgi:hypothetical protein